MSFSVAWDFPARAAFDRVRWPASADVDAAVQRFAERRAPHLPSGAYRLRDSGYRIALRVNHQAGTVLVLYLEPL